jgi:hypothetical protein
VQLSGQNALSEEGLQTGSATPAPSTSRELQLLWMAAPRAILHRPRLLSAGHRLVPFRLLDGMFALGESTHDERDDGSQAL